MSHTKLFSVITCCVAGMLALASCDKIKDAIKVDFDVTSSDISFTVPILDETGERQLSGDEVYLNVDSLIQAHNDEIGIENIKSVKIKSCTITLVNGDSVNNLSVFESAKVHLSSDGQPDLVVVAEVANNPDIESHTMELPVNGDIDLASYFTSRHFTYTLTGKSRRVTTAPLECKLSVTYNIVAGM